ncbi:hypothetical protein V5O48_000227 [Marasmius crinis-equi]|uniref:Uncharacterized protein n=1 Tax=Marasmius crinis-equi TaxID=585013 RepID=A0ABR3G1Y8_9AGAR
MKRRHPSNDGPGEEPRKRPKVNTLAHGFSNMSLSQQSVPAAVPVPDITYPQSATTTTPPEDAEEAMEIEEIPGPSNTQQIQIPPLELALPSIEEPSSPSLSASDIKMRRTTWYEPEPDREPPPSSSSPLSRGSNQPSFPSSSYTRPPPPPRPRTGIIITDLDSSSDEDEPSHQNEDEAEIEISPALLARIRERELLQQSVPLAQRQSQALVLYRPLTHSIPKDERAGEVAAEKTEDTTTTTQEDGMDMDMDVEPI